METQMRTFPVPKSVAYENGYDSASKESHTRLLDMLHGWSVFIQKEAETESFDPPAVADAVCELYQDAGAMDDTSSDAVRAFVQSRVVPLLLRNP